MAVLGLFKQSFKEFSLRASGERENVNRYR